MSGTAPCTVKSCRYEAPINVEGGRTEFERESARLVEAHQRSEHPWLFVEFSALGVAALHGCSWCGAAVSDVDAHRDWHRHAQA